VHLEVDTGLLELVEQFDTARAEGEHRAQSGLALSRPAAQEPAPVPFNENAPVTSGGATPMMLRM
jgi:hypothetical protein